MLGSLGVLQVQVAGLTSDIVGLTIELKPRRRNKRSVLYDLTGEYSRATGQAVGSWSRLEARHIHMLLQNELFINVATAHSHEGELRGQIKVQPYSGLEVPRHGEDQWSEYKQIKKHLNSKKSTLTCFENILHLVSFSFIFCFFKSCPLLWLGILCLHRYELEHLATPGCLWINSAICTTR